MPSPPPPDRPILILGAGIIGLTTALRLLESEPKRPVHIIADHWPSDPLSPRYASSIAGAHHLSFADDNDARQRRWDSRTFRVLYDEWQKHGESTGLMSLTQTELWVGSTTHLKIYEEHPNFTVLKPQDAPCPADHMISFTSLTVTPALYLASLESKIRKLGAHCHRVHLTSLAELAAPTILGYTTSLPIAVFICVGIGARFLGGLTDTQVYPTRGQVVKVRAPWIRSGWTRQVGSLNGGEGGARTYIIPRCTGEVILGGTREERDWTPYPREESSKDILKRCVEVCPDLVPPHTRNGGLEEAWAKESGGSGLEEIVVDTLVGFRPSRVGGVRLERQDIRLGGGNIAIVHNYGHGGAGWQSCWGCAEDAVALLDKAKL